LVYSSTLKMDVTYSSKTSFDFQQATWHYILDVGSLHNHCYENFKSYVWWWWTWHVPPKHHLTFSGLHGVIFYILYFITTAVKTSNPTYDYLFASLMKDNSLNWIFDSYLYLATHPKLYIDLYLYIILFLLQRIYSIYEHTPVQWNLHLRFLWGNWGVCIQCIRSWLYSHLWVVFVIILIFVAVVFFKIGFNFRNRTSDLLNTRFVC
jgi:hypothetical protein